MTTDGTVDDPDQLAALYRNRFSTKELAEKRVLWSALCHGMFQQYVPESGTVIDLGAGNCEFSNAIRARRRMAVDLNPETKHFADEAAHALLACSMLGCHDGQLRSADRRAARRRFRSAAGPTRRSSWHASQG